MKQDILEIKTIGNGYLIVQRNKEGVVKRIVGKINGRKAKNPLSLVNR
ncbi:MAG: hypothetical protein JJT76_03095 [Clostridiaceae bacterium]|nr:hypothetical protein [Clostridiaceae bacterium]